MPSSPEHGTAPGLSADELDAELATDLPEREALSIVDPGVFSAIPMPTPAARAPDVGNAELPITPDE